MTPITRRKLILGMGAGTGLLLPMVRTMMPEAMGQDPERKRILFYAGAVSASEPHFPKSDGQGGLVISEGFQPLAPHRDKMLFLRGLNAPWHKQLHGPDWLMTGRDGTPGGITLDRYLAKEIGQSDPVASIQLALAGCPGGSTSVSADGSGQVFPAETNPVKAFSDIFGGGVKPGGGEDRVAATERMLVERKSLLDFVSDDVGRMQPKLAQPERIKLDQYLTGLRDLEGELSNLAQAPPMAGPVCSDIAEPGDHGKPGQKADEKFIAAQVEVALNALICGMTRVAVLHKNCSSTYGFLGGLGGHNLWHGSSSGEKVKYYQYHAGNLAKIHERLGEVTEGAGTMADNSLIVYFERSGIHHHNGQGDCFFLTIGDGGGYLKTGRHLTYKGHNVNDALISMANTVGVDTDTFGDPKLARGPLPDLTA